MWRSHKLAAWLNSSLATTHFVLSLALMAVQRKTALGQKQPVAKCGICLKLQCAVLDSIVKEHGSFMNDHATTTTVVSRARNSLCFGSSRIRKFGV